MGSSMSNTILACWPREARPITSFICSSRQARTQRVHWMQASRLTAIAACDRSGATCGPRRKARLADLQLAAHSSTSLWRVYSFSGMSDCSSSITICCDLCTRSLSVVTCMPLSGTRQQDARQHPLALDLDHAGAAVAHRLHAGLVAKPGNLDAFAVGDLDERIGLRAR